MKSFIFCVRQKQIGDPQTKKYEYEYGFTFTFIFIRTFLMLPSQTQLPSASNIRIPQYTHHTPHTTLLQDWFKYSVDVHSRNTSMSGINKITSSLQETVRGKRLLKYDDWCRVRLLIWWRNVMRYFVQIVLRPFDESRSLVYLLQPLTITGRGVVFSGCHNWTSDRIISNGRSAIRQLWRKYWREYQ